MNKPYTEKVCPKCGQTIKIGLHSPNTFFVEHVRYCNAYKISWQNPR